MDDAQPQRQLYDHRGHPINPKSRAINRKFTKAMNDVLATCGMLRHDRHQDHITVESRSEVMQEASAYLDWSKEDLEVPVSENQVGALIQHVTPHVDYVCTWGMVGLRNRYQVRHSNIRCHCLVNADRLRE